MGFKISLKLLAIALISCLVASSLNDLIVPEANFAEDEMEVVAENNHAQQEPLSNREALTLGVLAKELDRDKTTTALCSEANDKMLNLIKAIKDPKQREESSKNLKKCMDEPVHTAAVAREEEALKKTIEAAQNKDLLHYKHFPDAETKKRAEKARAQSTPEPEQKYQALVEDEDPQIHAELVQMHSEFQDIIKKYNVDTSEARTRGPEEHNELITDFILVAFTGDASAGDTLVQQSPTSAGASAGANAGSAPDLTRADMDATRRAKLKIQGAKLVGKCLHGLMQTAPADFCWKDPKYHQLENPQCPQGWHRPWGYLECFKRCKAGYYFVSGGTCWQECNYKPPGRRLLGTNRKDYRDDGATCWKSWFDVFWKKWYWAERRGNCHDDLKCRPDQYKFGCLCYQDCATVGEVQGSMENCGTLACGASSGGCVAAVSNMVMDIGFSIASISALVVTGGAAAPAVVAGKKLLKKCSQSVMTKLSKMASESLLKAGKAQFEKAAVKLAMKRIKGAQKAMYNAINSKALANGDLRPKAQFKAGITDGMTQNAVKAVCGTVAQEFYKKLKTGSGDFHVKQLDPTGLAAAGESCVASATEPSTENHLKCVAATLGAINTFDPTGLMGVAAAFMHGTCKQPTPEDLTPYVETTYAPTMSDADIVRFNAARNWQPRSRFGRKNTPATNAPTKTPTNTPTTAAPSISSEQRRANLRRDALLVRRRATDARRRRTAAVLSSGRTVKLKGTGTNAVESFMCSNHAEGAGMSWSPANQECGQYGDWKLYFNGGKLTQGRTVGLKSTKLDKWLCSNMVQGMSWADPSSWDYCRPGSAKYAWKLYWVKPRSAGADSDLDSGTTVFLHQTDGRSGPRLQSSEKWLQSSAAEGQAPAWSATSEQEATVTATGVTSGPTFKIFF